MRPTHFIGAAVAIAAWLAPAWAGHSLPPIGGAVMLNDPATLVVSAPSHASLIYFDTAADKELKRVEVEFQPLALAVQGDKLFASTKGSAILHILEAASGKELDLIKLPGEPIQALACHPTKGLVYAVNLANEVYSIDPAKKTANKTRARGQLIAVDPADGKHVYTGVQKPIRDQIVFQEGPGGRTTISLMRANIRALLLKFAVDGADLKPIAANDNAAINGKGIGLSADGKRIAMAGGGGWQSKTDRRANYAIAVFDTSDMTTMLGQIDTGAYPTAVAFHPVLIDSCATNAAKSHKRSGRFVFSIKDCKSSGCSRT